MFFKYERLIKIREELGINKAEAARRLNMSAMGYGRYEKGEREPSFQTVSFMANIFGTTPDYLYGLSDNSRSDTITISMSENPELYLLVESLIKDRTFAKRMYNYSKKIQAKGSH